jgi:hypothetical protein
MSICYSLGLGGEFPVSHLLAGGVLSGSNMAALCLLSLYTYICTYIFDKYIKEKEKGKETLIIPF